MIVRRAEGWLDLCRRLYNAALEQRVTAYRRNRISISRFAQDKELPALKKEFPEFKEVGSGALQETLQRLDKSYQDFFCRAKAWKPGGHKPGFPRFKSRNRYNSFTLKRAGWKLEGKHLIIKKVGRFKIRLSRPIEGTIKTITVCRTPVGCWFVSFSCDDVLTRPLPLTGKEVGIDVGCESFFTSSDGKVVENPRFFKRSEELLAMRQRRKDRRKKGSNRRNKARILEAKAHAKISNQRRDFQFKTANHLLKSYDTIYIEKMKAWHGWRTLNKSMRDASWFGFFTILRQKAEEAVAREIFEVPAKNTSQMCSGCGALVPKGLGVRIHSCPHCGLVIHRDLNASLNILRAGQALRNQSRESRGISRGNAKVPINFHWSESMAELGTLIDILAEPTMVADLT